jgi:hypothetical protein
MSDHELEDRLFLAVRDARPEIPDHVLSPAGPNALGVVERVLRGSENGPSTVPRAASGKPNRRGARGPRISRRLRPRRLAVAVAAAATIAVGVVGLTGVSGAPSLVDRAYAAISASDQVLHEVVDTRISPGPAPHDCGRPEVLKLRIKGKLKVVEVGAPSDCNSRSSYEQLEEWLLPADGRVHVITRYGGGGGPNLVGEGIITSSGRAFWRVFVNDKPQAFMCRPYCSLGWNRLRPGDSNGSSWRSENFVSAFQTAYKGHELVADGQGTFDGRRVARYRSIYRYPAEPGRVAPRGTSASPSSAYQYTITEWYIDPAAARPLGSTTWQQCTSDSISSCTGGTVTERILTFQLLDPTPQNLAHLITPDAPAGAR